MLLFLKKAISFVKKAFLVIVIYFVVVNLFFYFISKDKIDKQPKTDPIEKSRAEIYKVLSDPKLKTSKEGQISLVIYRSMMCGMIGEACTDNPADGDKNFNHSLFGYMTNLIVLPYANPPASGIYWAYSGLQNAGFVPKTYAAEGIGFSAIKPYSKLWGIFRALAYMVLVLVLIAIGFMIMFRMKINPQTIIGVENALPRIIISLLLITFSFAIAGFLIDLMYLLITVIISLLITFDKGDFKDANKVNLINSYAGASFGQLWPLKIGIDDLYLIGNSLFEIIPPTVQNIVRLVLAPVLATALTFFAYRKIPPLANSLKNVGGQAVGTGFSLGSLVSDPIAWLIEIILFFIFVQYAPGLILGVILIGFTLMFLMFRIFFILLTTYIQTLLLIIFSPIILLAEAIPGKNAFSYWFKNLFVNLLTFPLIILLLLIGRLIMYINFDTGNNFWVPPFLYGIKPQNFSTIVGIGIILLIPDFIKTVKELLGAKGLPIGLGIGTFAGGAGAPLGGAIGMLGQFSTIKLGMSALGRGAGLFGLQKEKKPPPEVVPEQSGKGSEGTALEASAKA